MCLIRIIRVEVWPYDGINKMGSQVDDLCVLSSDFDDVIFEQKVRPGVK